MRTKILLSFLMLFLALVPLVNARPSKFPQGILLAPGYPTASLTSGLASAGTILWNNILLTPYYTKDGSTYSAIPGLITSINTGTGTIVLVASTAIGITTAKTSGFATITISVNRRIDSINSIATGVFNIVAGANTTVETSKIGSTTTITINSTATGIRTKMLTFPVIVPSPDALAAGFDLSENAFIFAPTTTKSVIFGAILAENYDDSASIAVRLICKGQAPISLASAVFTLDYKAIASTTDSFYLLPWIRVATQTISIASTTKIQYLSNPGFVLGPEKIQNNGYFMVKVSRIGGNASDSFGGNLLLSQANASILENE